MKKLYFILLFTALTTTSLLAQTVRYVKTIATGTGDGSTWANATADLQGMINASASGDQVWVAAGTYKPTEKLQATTYVTSPAVAVATTERDQSFIMKSGVKVYGGFAGTESLLSDRNFTVNVSILSGDLDGSTTASSGDAYHVVTSRSSITVAAILDGFTIQHGYADGAGDVSSSSTTLSLTISQSAGGAIALRGPNNGIQFANLIIKDNYAADYAGAVALYISGSVVIPFTNVTFSNNTSVNEAGAIRIYSSSVTPTVSFTNSKFLNNTAGTSGGAVYYYSSSTTATYLVTVNFGNCVFYNNEAKSSTIGGGAIYASTASSSTFTNTTFYANKASGTTGKGGAIISNSATAVVNVNNSIVNGNIASTAPDLRVSAGAINVKNTLTQAYGAGSTGVIVNPTATPLFASTTSTDANFLTLLEGVATEKGDNTLIGSLTTDLAGNARIKYTNVDLGAYEYQGTLPVTLVSYDAVRNGNSTVLTWKTAEEKNNAKFVLERGTSMSNFVKIKEVTAAGGTTALTSYSFTDFSPAPGTNYYKLTQFDNDGTATLLGVKAVSFSFATASMKAYPNPATTFVYVKLDEITTGTATVNLVSLTGKTVLTKTYAAADLQEAVKFDISSVPAGAYVIWVKGASLAEKQTLLVVK